MDALFQRIVQTTKASRETVVEPEPLINDETEPDMLERHINEVMDHICYGFEENVTAAAERGVPNAIVTLYRADALYRGIIPIHDLLMPSASIGAKLTEYGILGLFQRLQDKFAPFTVRVARLDSLVALKDRENIYCVVIAWDAGNSTPTHVQLHTNVRSYAIDVELPEINREQPQETHEIEPETKTE